MIICLSLELAWHVVFYSHSSSGQSSSIFHILVRPSLQPTTMQANCLVCSSTAAVVRES